jgi:formate dehydrogenase iron-sulfur subunit
MTPPGERVGFFTDTSICIGCKACEVACKEWNGVPDDGLDLLGLSYDNRGGLSANTWRHVAFIEQRHDDGMRWLMMSDVCKHCTHAGCLDVCPTGALFRSEFGTVVVQDDVCNGCGYCIPACPYGVIDQRDPDNGVGGDGAFFLLLDEPEVYGLPPDPVVPTRDLPAMWRRAGLAALTLAAATVAAFAGRRGPNAVAGGRRG